MISKLLQSIWGNLSKDEIKKFGILSGVFFLVIGTYQMFKAMKDPMFDLYVGVDWTPRAKLLSIVFIALVILMYSKLIDLFKRQQVFYIVCGTYATIFLILSYLMNSPELLAKGNIAGIPGNVLGWALYLLVESFGSIMPALFWGFVASVTTADSAKRGYPMITMFTQLGAILGPLTVMTLSSHIPSFVFFILGSVLIFIVPLLITVYHKVVPADISITTSTSKQSTGFFEGLRLLVSKKYLMGIFVITTFYETVTTILDFQKIKLMASVFPSKADGGAAYQWIKGLEGTGFGIIAFLFALLGTSFFMRKFGLRFCLVMFPSIIAAVVIGTFVSYQFGFSPYYLMWIFLSSIVVIKGLNYSLNNPTRQVLYIPTSKDVKMKTTGWIDAFGARLMKGAGSGITDTLKGSLPVLVTVGTALSLGLVATWIVVAGLTSVQFEELQKENKIIE